MSGKNRGGKGGRDGGGRRAGRCVAPPCAAGRDRGGGRGGGSPTRGAARGGGRSLAERPQGVVGVSPGDRGLPGSGGNAVSTASAPTAGPGRKPSSRRLGIGAWPTKRRRLLGGAGRRTRALVVPLAGSPLCRARCAASRGWVALNQARLESAVLLADKRRVADPAEGERWL